jgi:nitrogen fixation NifU-like protein
MTSDLEALYRDAIVDHSKHPRNRRPLEAGRKADGFNPICGDRLTVYVEAVDGVIRDASFEGLGCAIAIASASLMTESVKGQTVAPLAVSTCTTEARIVECMHTNDRNRRGR